MALRRLFGSLLLGALAATTTAASADEPESPPSAKLEVTPAATGAWLIKIINTGETPLLLAADPRLLWLEVGTQQCALPEDARPSTDEGKELVIPANRSWSASIDPLFYCFTPAQRGALTAGATVHAHFGWKAGATKGKATMSPPYAIAPVGASVGKVKPAKEIASDPITLKDAVTEVKPPEKESDKEKAAKKDDPFDLDTPKASLTLPVTMDAAKGDELTTTVTFHNESDRTITLMFRPDMVQFTVHGPFGTVGCGTPREIASPMRELFITVGARSQTSMAVLFTATCNPGTFDAAGLYRVDARLDTRQASGRSINLKSWDSVATTTEPMVLRVRESKHAGPGRRPQLD